jgi:hypothetical protein
MGEQKRMYEFPTAAEIERLRAEQRRRGQPEKWGITDDHNTFANYAVPSVLLIDFERRMPDRAEDPRYERWWHTAADNLDATDSDSLAFVGNLLMQAMPKLEAFCLGTK